MNKETRINHIESLQPYGETEIRWEDTLQPFPTYKIPLKYLIYNKYNGRILSRTKSLEKQGEVIDSESDEGKILIEKLLWNSKIDRNNKTLESLKKYGQEKIGIVTKDGIIIDGNRRAMLLNQIDKYDYFKAVVLPVCLDENPIEIERLETSHQMGEDKKLDYNPIEKYIKVKEIIKKLSSTCNEDEAKDKIKDWMNEPLSEIQKYIDVMETMDDYLDSLEYNGIYTQLDGREDHLISLTKWKKTFLNTNDTPPTVTESLKAFTGYSADDVDDLLNISYDYIRAKYEGKEFRKLSEGQRDKHLFGDENIWGSFKDKHFETIDLLLESETDIDFDSQNLDSHLKDRDNQYRNNVEIFLKTNLNEYYQLVKNKQYKDEPEKLVKNAKRSIESIGQNHSSLDSDIVQNEIKDLNKTINTLLMKSPLKTLEYINELLDEIEINTEEDNSQIYEEVSKTNKLSFNLKKQLGG